MKKSLPANLLDIALRIRPGAFSENAAALLDLVKATAQMGGAEVVAPADLIRGGDCGSLNDHPAFQAALAAAQEKFLKAVAKIKRAPKITFTSGGWGPSPIAGAGPDPRLPFWTGSSGACAKRHREPARAAKVKSTFFIRLWD